MVNEALKEVAPRFSGCRANFLLTKGSPKSILKLSNPLRKLGVCDTPDATYSLGDFPSVVILANL